ncbi:SAF domain-containing protein [Oerskovia flava]|uniref:SAF domain-containing protein n=1 Tax=Oerskovia flava TaxID=2986422 RepID=UPI00223FE700|nr:SAF domain-containing protein [Oerskovia sp. JB1-3-2]
MPSAPSPVLPDAGARPPRSGRLRRRSSALLWRLRFVVAAVACGLAAAVVVGELRPAPPPTEPVVVTARAVDAGTVLRVDDLDVVHLPVGLAPDGVLSTQDAASGRTASLALARGLPLTPELVAAGEVTASAPAGTVVAPVRLSDSAVAALLVPGDRVDLLVGADGSGHSSGHDTGDDPPTPYLARGAIVLPGTPPPTAAGGLLGGSGDAAAGVTLVAVTPQEAVQIATVSGWGTVAAVLVP